MKNILILTNAYPETHLPLRGLFIKALADRLSKIGYAVTVLAPRMHAQSAWDEPDEAVHIVRFRSGTRGKFLIQLRGISLLKVPLYFIFLFLRLGRLLLSNRPDLIHAHWIYPSGLAACLAHRIFRIPFAITIHGSDWRLANKNRFLKKLTMRILPHASFLTVVSPVMHNALIQHDHLASKTMFFPDGIDLDIFHPRLRKTTPQRHALRIISTRNFFKLYQVDLLGSSIPAMLRTHPHAQFIFIGYGPEEEELRARLKSLIDQGRICFIGQVPNHKMSHYLSSSDIYISTSPVDGTSVSLLEAMACGCLPVVTDIPENRFWIEQDINGYLFRPGDGAHLCEMLSMAIQTVNSSLEFRVHNWRRIQEKADWECHIQQLNAAYNTSFDGKS